MAQCAFDHAAAHMPTECVRVPNSGRSNARQFRMAEHAIALDACSPYQKAARKSDSESRRKPEAAMAKVVGTQSPST